MSASLFTAAEEGLKTGKPFVVFSKPLETKMTGLFNRDSNCEVPDDLVAPGFLFSPFLKQNKHYFIPVEHCDIIREDLPKFSKKVGALVQSDGSQQYGFEALVATAISKIKSTDIKKIVLSRNEDFKLKDFELKALMESLFSEYPQSFRYLWHHPETGIWCGASPELLIALDEGEYRTMALAGTIKQDADASVQWTEKEIREQDLVTEAIVEALKPFSSSLSIKGPIDQRAGSMVHLRSDISGILKDHVDLKMILDSLHPTPAICGTPRSDSLQFINLQEGYDREYYSGYLGPLNIESKQSSLYVNLRCMKVEANKARIFTGGGITEDSDPEMEWIETCNKQQTMLKVLRQFL